MRAEAVEALAVKPDGLYVDCTFGRGGHSLAVLERIGPRGALLALDRDPLAVSAAAHIVDARFHIVHARFGQLRECVAARGWTHVDGILLDLGVSSPQIDTPERGFSFRLDGPLDMRMDTTGGQSAQQWLAQASEDDIKEVIKTYGEERFAGPIARAIVAARSRGAVHTTGQLAKIVGQAVRTREPGQDPATRTFQAIRIFVNQELEELSLALDQALDLLAPRGRLVVITFHSLEDRLVKRFIRREAQGDPVYAGLPDVPAHARPRLRLVGGAVMPSDAEIAGNPRARSAVLRVAARIAA